MRNGNLLCIALTLVASACATRPADGSNRQDSGQSGLMNETFAGRNACNPDDHARPFIIEWDATDRSSFEAIAANDIIFVRYQGCQLTVLDECRNESLRGERGAYLPPEWTSGGLETIDIKTEGELKVKLPLGVTTLGSRVASGEAFHMEYYVAGTKQATRDAVHRDTLGDDPGCNGATHFVHAYNLGAFALGSTQELNIDAGGSAYGFGAAGRSAKSSRAEKSGGDLSVCKSTDATEARECQTPVRLSLRKIRDGRDPSAAAQTVPDTDDSLNAAGELAQRLEMSEDARARMDAAQRKLAARDGTGCVEELDQHAKLDARHASTMAGSPLARTRSLCLMLAGKCDAGRKLLRQHLEHDPMASTNEPRAIDIEVTQMTNRFCEGSLPPRDDVFRSAFNLRQGAEGREMPPGACAKHFNVIKKQWATIVALNDENVDHILRMNLLGLVPRCFEQAKDCDSAWKAYSEIIELLEGLPNIYFSGDKWNAMTPEQQQRQMQGDFAVICKTCGGAAK